MNKLSSTNALLPLVVLGIAFAAAPAVSHTFVIIGPDPADPLDNDGPIRPDPLDPNVTPGLPPVKIPGGDAPSGRPPRFPGTPPVAPPPPPANPTLEQTSEHLETEAEFAEEMADYTEEFLGPNDPRNKGREFMAKLAELNAEVHEQLYPGGAHPSIQQ